MCTLKNDMLCSFYKSPTVKFVLYFISIVTVYSFVDHYGAFLCRFIERVIM